MEHGSGTNPEQEREEALNNLRQALDLVRQAREGLGTSVDRETVENLLTAEAALKDSLYSFR